MAEAAASRRFLVGAWAGVLAPVFFVCVFLVEGAARPGYSAASSFVSELALGDRGWLQISNFLVLGTSLLLFSRALSFAFHDSRRGQKGAALIGFIGVCYFASGPFVMDPPGTPRSDFSVEGLLHGVFGAFVFSLSPVSCIVLQKVFRDRDWRWFHMWTLLITCICTLAAILLTVATKVPDAFAALTQHKGVVQRALLIPHLVWLSTLAIKVGHRRDARPLA